MRKAMAFVLVVLLVTLIQSSICHAISNLDFLIDTASLSKAEIADLNKLLEDSVGRDFKQKYPFYTEDAVKVYFFKSFNLSELQVHFKEALSLQESILEQFMYMIPAKQTGSIIQVRDISNPWAIVAGRDFLTLYEEKYQTPYLDYNSIAKIIEKSSLGIDYARFVITQEYYSQFLFFTYKDTEYLIPLLIQDYSGLETLEIYKVEAALKILEKNMPPGDPNAEVLFGGAARAVLSRNLFFWVSITALSAIMVAYLLTRKRNITRQS